MTPSQSPERAKDDGGTEPRWSRWMAAAQDGDRAAYERLLRDILPFLRSIARRQHAREDRVEDVVQDVLMTLHRVRHTYDPARPFTQWLAVLARRRSIDLLRRRLRVAAVEVADDAAYETFADPGANRQKEAQEAREGLGAALAGLPAGQREAVELLRLRELSLAEASRRSGKSVGALKVNMHRALKALRRTLRGGSS